MPDSKTLIDMHKAAEQGDLINKLKDSDAGTHINTINAVGPNEDYPRPWVIAKFPGLSICSIISTGGKSSNTVISMIKLQTAETVLEEIE